MSIKKTAASPPPPSSSTPLSGRVRANFPQWDGDSNGFLSESEIDRAIHDATIKGADAAALAALKKRIYALESLADDELFLDNDGVTLRDLGAYERAHANGDATAAGEAETWFREANMMIARSSTTAFTNGAADYGAVRQGAIHDCWFVAALAAKAARDPAAIARMVDDNEDGTFTVRFPGEEPVTVSAPADAELARYASSGGDGSWLTIVEKAFGRLRGGGGDGPPQEAANGGRPLFMGIGAVTGRGTDTDVLSFTRLSRTRTKLEAAMEEHRAVTASIRKAPLGDERRQGLPMGHAYSVIDFDPTADEITLRNPWGQTELVDAQGRARDAVDDGQFTMTLEEFDETFTDICYEVAD